jgi:NADH-quinone oxidoreductase subunit L
MTHAFFKALLFMAAGSLIGAMAGDQSLDRMSGFRKAMPFTFACFIIGGLALSGCRRSRAGSRRTTSSPTSTTAAAASRSSASLGYVGALLTGIYTFRMIFRAFFGEPCPEAKELEQGHLAHAEVPTNPQTGEVEDTDVGFPGPEHHIAEREWPMKIAMGTLALLAVVGGCSRSPASTTSIRTLPRPHVRRLAPVAAAEPSTGNAWIGLIIGAVIASSGSRSPTGSGCSSPAPRPRLRSGSPPCTASSSTSGTSTS